MVLHFQGAKCVHFDLVVQHASGGKLNLDFFSQSSTIRYQNLD